MKCIGGGPRLLCDRCRTLHQKCSLVQQGSELVTEKLEALCGVLVEMAACQRALLELKMKKHGMLGAKENALVTEEKGIGMEDKEEGPSGVEKEPEGPVATEEATLGAE